MATMTTKAAWHDYAILTPSIPRINPKTGQPEEWKVQQNQHGDFRCSCKSFIFSRETPKSCKHVRKILATNSTEGLNLAPGSPTAAPSYFEEARLMVHAMVGAAKLVVSSSQQSTLITTLCGQLASFKPAPQVMATPATAGQMGVRRITFDD